MELLAIIAVVIAFFILAPYARKARHKRIMYGVLIAGIVWQTIDGIVAGVSLRDIGTTALILSIPLIVVYAEWTRQKAQGVAPSYE